MKGKPFTNEITDKIRYCDRVTPVAESVFPHPLMVEHVAGRSVIWSAGHQQRERC
jgi:hypothetical protein